MGANREEQGLKLTLPKKSAGLSVLPWKKMQANLDPTYTFEKRVSVGSFRRESNHNNHVHLQINPKSLSVYLDPRSSEVASESMKGGPYSMG